MLFKSEPAPIPESCFTFDAGTITEYKCGSLVAPGVPNSNVIKDISDVIIPGAIRGETVNTIGREAFSNTDITSVIIPGSVITIEDYAFSENRLTNVIIMRGRLQTIKSSAFSRNRLTNMTIPSSVTSVGDYAFADNQLTNVIIQGKSSTSDFTTYGSNVWGWASGYSDDNITWQP